MSGGVGLLGVPTEESPYRENLSTGIVIDKLVSFPAVLALVDQTFLRLLDCIHGTLHMLASEVILEELSLLTRSVANGLHFDMLRNFAAS